MKDRRKNILNFSERKTAFLLREIVGKHDCSVNEKVRVADVLHIENSNLTKEEYGYALKSHFDFVVCQKIDTKALFAVEFDGPYHQYDKRAQRRDTLKDSICEKLGIPLLRVDSEFINQKVGRFQLLTYFVDIWFLFEAFSEQQAEGYIPEDELFDPYSIIKVENGQIKREFDPAQESKEFLYSLTNEKAIQNYPPITLTGTDKSERYSVCLAMVFVKDGTLLSTGCFKQVKLWPVLSTDIAEDIAIIGLSNEADKYIKGYVTPYDYNKIRYEFNRWKYSIEWKIFKDENGFPCFRYEHKPNRKK